MTHRHGLLICFRQQDLGPRAHPQQPVLLIHRVGHQIGRLAHQLGVDDRHELRVIPRGVLHHQDHLHALPAVVLQVLEILHMLDDGQQDLAVAGPVEDAVHKAVLTDHRQHLRRQPLVGQHHHRRPRTALLDPLAELDRVHVTDARHGDDKIIIAGAQRLERLRGRRHPVDPRHMVDFQIDELVENPLGQLPVLLEHKAVIQRGHQQHIVHPEFHEVAEPQEPRLEFVGAHLLKVGRSRLVRKPGAFYC